MSKAVVSEAVRGQYEDLPYPARNPEDETKRLTLSALDCPDQINHMCLNGERDFTKKIRVLIAGGGTGDSLVQWTVALKDNPEAEIIYLDFSTASRKLATQRLAMHGLENKPRFITDSILNIPNLDLGKFDIINCTGVLHHLEDPDGGLKILADRLDENGVMNIMLYGAYGRMAVYPMQEIMRYINKDTASPQEKIENTRSILKSITSKNNFYPSLVNFGDYSIDEEVYDIFMHNQDRAYTVKQVYEFANSANLKLVRFGQNAPQETMDYYAPEKYIANKELLQKIKELHIQQQQSIAELMNGSMIKHCFYLSKKERKKLELGLDLIPNFSLCLPKNVLEGVAKIIAKSEGIVQLILNNNNLSFLKTPHLAEIVAGIDGKATMREILSRVMKTSKVKNCNFQTLLAEFSGLFNLLENHYFICLRQPGLPTYLNFSQYQSEKFGHLFKTAAQA